MVAAAVVALAAVGIAHLGGGGGARAGQPQDRPNVVVLMTDDQTVESTRVMKKLDRLLARRGVSFENSYASNPICCPSRASYLTGQYSHNNGVLRNSTGNGGYEALDGSGTFPVALERSGYVTAHIGKYLNGYGLRSDPTEVPPGWDEWYGAVDGSTYRMYGYTLNENGELVTYGRFGVEEAENYQTDVYSRKAADFIERRAPSDQPFFLSLAPLAPHVETKERSIGGDDDPPITNFPNPRAAPRDADAFKREPLPMSESFDEDDVSDKPSAIAALPPLEQSSVTVAKKRYRSRLGSLLAVDDMIGNLIRTLRQSGELDDTVFIFTSDNGFLLGEHRIRTGKQYLYEESARVPLIIRGPGVPHGATRTQPAMNVDLAPTILDYADAAPIDEPDGRSLRRLIQRSELQPGRAVLLENWCQAAEPCYEPNRPRYQAVRTQRYLYGEYPNGDRELYDVDADPFQLESLDGDPAKAGAERALARLLGRMRRCAGSSCRSAPRVRLRLDYRRERAGGVRCSASDVHVRVGGNDSPLVIGGELRLGSSILTDDVRPVSLRVRRAELDREAKTPVASTLTTRDGRLFSAADALPRRC